MSMQVYKADNSNKVHSLSHEYQRQATYVVHISDNAVQQQFVDSNSSNSTLTAMYRSISFGSNVQSILPQCCYQFSSLQRIAFSGQKVKTIGNSAFSKCTALTTVTIPKSVSTIEDDAFAGCTSLVSVAFSNASDISVGRQAFMQCKIAQLKLVARYIGPRAFASCTSLNQVVLNGQLSEEMFDGCTSLTKVRVDARTTAIPSNCFRRCSKLDQVIFQQSRAIDSIGDGAFNGCSSLMNFALESTSVAYIGSGVFSGSGITSIVLPLSIQSTTQLNAQFLAGSSIHNVKFLSMTSNYMIQHKTEFTPFGSAISTLTIESSDGIKYNIDASGLIISTGGVIPIAPGTGKVYVISIAISDSLGDPDSKLIGMDRDTNRFLDLIDQAYADNPGLIVGTAKLNDDSTADKTGKGTPANINAAFDDAKLKGADFVIFHYSDHGQRRSQSADGYLCTYDGNYSYATLFSKLQQFKYAFVLLCCCYPNSVNTEFTPGPLGTKALFWCAGGRNTETWMNFNEGHVFMTLLIKKFNKQLSWAQQFELVHVTQTNGRGNNVVTATPHQYIYGDFPMDDKVFRVS